MILLWIIFGALLAVAVLHVLSENCGSQLTANDYKENKIHEYFDQKQQRKEKRVK